MKTVNDEVIFLASKAISTINAPLPIHISAETLIDCILLNNKDKKWVPHLKSFFNDINADIIVDLVVESAVTFDNYKQCIDYHNLKDTDNAEWIEGMAS